MPERQHEAVIERAHGQGAGCGHDTAADHADMQGAAQSGPADLLQQVRKGPVRAVRLRQIHELANALVHDVRGQDPSRRVRFGQSPARPEHIGQIGQIGQGRGQRRVLTAKEHDPPRPGDIWP